MLKLLMNPCHRLKWKGLWKYEQNKWIKAEDDEIKLIEDKNGLEKRVELYINAQSAL